MENLNSGEFEAQLFFVRVEWCLMKVRLFQFGSGFVALLMVAVRVELKIAQLGWMKGLRLLFLHRQTLIELRLCSLLLK